MGREGALARDEARPRRPEGASLQRPGRELWLAGELARDNRWSSAVVAARQAREGAGLWRRSLAPAAVAEQDRAPTSWGGVVLVCQRTQRCLSTSREESREGGERETWQKNKTQTDIFINSSRWVICGSKSRWKQGERCFQFCTGLKAIFGLKQ